jgi:hypothetical protein
MGTGTAGIDFESTAQAMIDAICLYLLGDTQIHQVTVTIYSSRSKTHRRPWADPDKDLAAKELESFYTQAIRKGSSWSKLQKYLKEIPDLLQELNKEEWIKEVNSLRKKILN